jgi:hypothetical protein
LRQKWRNAKNIRGIKFVIIAIECPEHGARVGFSCALANKHAGAVDIV